MDPNYKELLARIEALEAAQQQPAPPAPAEGLVELIRDELGHHGTASASAVIRKVATWLRERGWTLGARVLDLEAER
jgi:BMFP domain-containing protein YqiC